MVWVKNDLCGLLEKKGGVKVELEYCKLEHLQTTTFPQDPFKQNTVSLGPQ